MKRGETENNSQENIAKKKEEKEIHIVCGEKHFGLKQRKRNAELNGYMKN